MMSLVLKSDAIRGNITTGGSSANATEEESGMNHIGTENMHVCSERVTIEN